MDQTTPRPWLLDERVGCLAIYAGEKQNCLEGAREWAIHYCAGNRIETEDNSVRWTMDEEKVANARLIVTAVNAHDDLVAACRMAARLCKAVESAEFVGNDNRTATITAKDLTILLVRYADCRAALQKAGIEV